MSQTEQEFDYISVLPRPVTARGFITHDVENMPGELPESNLYDDDTILKSAIDYYDAT